jgi:hypothetical protein
MGEGIRGPAGRNHGPAGRTIEGSCGPATGRRTARMHEPPMSRTNPWHRGSVFLASSGSARFGVTPRGAPGPFLFSPCRAACAHGCPWPGASAAASHLAAGPPCSERLGERSSKSVPSEDSSAVVQAARPLTSDTRIHPGQRRVKLLAIGVTACRLPPYATSRVYRSPRPRPRRQPPVPAGLRRL